MKIKAKTPSQQKMNKQISVTVKRQSVETQSLIGSDDYKLEKTGPKIIGKAKSGSDDFKLKKIGTDALAMDESGSDNYKL